MSLVAGILVVKALEDPDLVRNCGDARALALGLTPVKAGYASAHVSAPAVAVYAAPVVAKAPALQFNAIQTGHLGYAAHLQAPTGLVYAKSPQNYAVTPGLSLAKTVYASVPSTIGISAPASYQEAAGSYSHSAGGSLEYGAVKLSAPAVTYQVASAPIVAKFAAPSVASAYYSSSASHSDESAASYSSYSPGIQIVSHAPSAVLTAYEPLPKTVAVAPAVKYTTAVQVQPVAYAPTAIGHVQSANVAVGHTAPAALSSVSYTAPAAQVLSYAVPKAAPVVSTTLIDGSHASGDLLTADRYAAAPAIATVSQTASHLHAKQEVSKHDKYYVSRFSC